MFACLEKGYRAKRAEGGGRDDSGRDDGGVQNQEGAEREEPGLRAEARWGGGALVRQQRPSQRNTLCGTQEALCCPHFTEQENEAQGG